MYAPRNEVIGTTRSPDGDTNGRIDGLVLQGNGTPELIDLRTAISKAQNRELWTKVAGQAAQVIAVDTDGDGVPDAVRTTADTTTRNNLLSLRIWDRTRRTWVDPSRGGY